MTINEFIHWIQIGMEYPFYYNNKKYWISSTKGHYFLANGEEAQNQDFLSAKDLLVNGMVDGKKYVMFGKKT